MVETAPIPGAISFACHMPGSTVQCAIPASSNIDQVFIAFGNFLKGCGFPALLTEKMIDAATQVGNARET